MDKSNPLDILGRRALHAMRRTEAALSPWVRRALRRQHQTIEHAHLAMSLNELPLRRLRRRVARQLNEDGSLAGDMGSLSPELVQRFTDRVVNRLPMRKIAAKYEAATAEKGDQTSDELPSTAMPLVNSYGNEAATHSSPKNQDADSAPMLTAADVIARLQTQMPNAGTQGNTPTQPSSTQTSAATPSRLQRIQAARETTERASISNSANTEKSPLASNPVARPNTGAIRRFSRVEEVSPAAKNSTPVSTTAQPRNRAARSTSLPAAAPTDNDASKDDDSRTGSAQDPLASIPTKQPQAAAPKTKEIAASTPAVLPAVTRSFAPTLTTAPTITSGSVPIQRSEMPETDFAIHQQAEQQMASAATSRATPVQRLAHTPRLLQAKRKSAQLRKDIADALGSATTESGSTSEPQVAKSNTKPPITRSPAQASNPVGNLQASEMQGIQSLNPTTTQIRQLPSDRAGATRTNQEISSQPELSSPSMQRSSLHERVSDTPHSIDSTFATPIAFEEPAAKSPQMMRHESKFEQAQRSADPQTRPVANIDATQDQVDGGVIEAQPRINTNEVDIPLARQSHLQRGGKHGDEVDTDTHVSDETSQQNAFDTSAISKLAETEAKASQPTLNRSIDNAPLTSTATAVNTPTIAANTLQPTIERHIDDPLEPNIASRSEKPSVVSHTADEIESAKLQREGIARPSNENRNTTSESTTPATRQIARLPTEIQFDSQQFEATPGLSGAAQPDAHLGTSPLTEALDMPLVQRSKQAVTDEGASDSTVEVNAPIMHVGASKVATRKSETTRQGTEPSVALAAESTSPLSATAIAPSRQTARAPSAGVAPTQIAAMAPSEVKQSSPLSEARPLAATQSAHTLASQDGPQATPAVVARSVADPTIDEPRVSPTSGSRTTGATAIEPILLNDDVPLIARTSTITGDQTDAPDMPLVRQRIQSMADPLVAEAHVLEATNPSSAIPPQVQRTANAKPEPADGIDATPTIDQVSQLPQSKTQIDLSAMTRMAQSIQRLPLTTRTRRMLRSMRSQDDSSLISPLAGAEFPVERIVDSTKSQPYRDAQLHLSDVPKSGQFSLSRAQAIQRMTDWAGQKMSAVSDAGAISMDGSTTQTYKRSIASGGIADLPQQQTSSVDEGQSEPLTLTTTARNPVQRMAQSEATPTHTKLTKSAVQTQTHLGQPLSTPLAMAAQRLQRQQPTDTTSRRSALRTASARYPAQPAPALPEIFAKEGVQRFGMTTPLQRRATLSATLSEEWGSDANESTNIDDDVTPNASGADKLATAWSPQSAQRQTQMPLATQKARSGALSGQSDAKESGTRTNMINAEALMRATVAAASPNTSQPTSMFASTSSANQEASPKNNTLLMPLNSGTKSSNISVQRKVETSLDSLQDFQSNNSGNSGETPVITPRLPELADLARQVYPLIKRLIAMERERVRSF